MFYRIYAGDDGQSHMEEYSPPDDIPATGIISVAMNLEILSTGMSPLESNL